MPFDPNTGVWVTGGDRPWQMPTFSAGDALSAFNSYDAYRRNKEAGVLDMILKIRESGEIGADVAGSPRGGAAMETFGIQPTEIQDMYEQSPEARFRQGIQLRAERGEPITEEMVSELGLQTGYVDPKTYLTSSSRALGEKTRQQRADTDARKAFNKVAVDEWKEALKVSNNDDEAHTRWAARMKFYDPSLTDEDLNAARARISGAFGGTEGAKRDKALAEAGLAETKASAILAKLPAQIDAMNASSAANTALAGLRAASQELTEAKTAGTLPATEAELMQGLSQAENTSAQLERVFPMASQRQSLETAKKEIKERIASIKAELSGKKAGAKDAGAGGAKKDYGPAGGQKEGATGTAEDGTRVIVRGGRIVAQ